MKRKDKLPSFISRCKWDFFLFYFVLFFYLTGAGSQVQTFNFQWNKIHPSFSLQIDLKQMIKMFDVLQSESLFQAEISFNIFSITRARYDSQKIRNFWAAHTTDNARALVLVNLKVSFNEPFSPRAEYKNEKKLHQRRRIMSQSNRYILQFTFPNLGVSWGETWMARTTKSVVNVYDSTGLLAAISKELSLIVDLFSSPNFCKKSKLKVQQVPLCTEIHCLLSQI